MFYIRKLSKKSNLYKIREASTSADVPADVLKQELATRENTLSFWKCDDLCDIRDTLKAILLSTTSIETSQFIVVDDTLLEKYHIEIDTSKSGETAYMGYEKLHVDFCNLTYEKIGGILNMLRETGNNKELMPELKREDVKKYIVEVKNEGLLNEAMMKPELKNAIERYCMS